MAGALPKLDSPDGAILEDFRLSLWKPFQDNYEDMWDQAKWDMAVEDFEARQNPFALQDLRERKLIPPWDAVASQIRKGPPSFLRPGWTSPLLGKSVDLEWIDRGAFLHVQGSQDGWRTKKVLVIEFWASWCRPCHRVFGHLSEIATNPDVKVLTYNHEGIFNQSETDVEALKTFIQEQGNLHYPVFVDVNRVAIDAIFRPGQNLSIPLVFIITPKDGVVHWIGNADAEDMGEPLERVLLSL
ncbi:hypothetical protein EIP91_004369 [Steccherinum ochraceum]|uniref:Thioredoxin domain-containing protein n=1 Tax=Steccherinum ochraceum TaxID=92696 RepID=A0A4R0RN27_9APHY|nr:hypothetical protein EIP91_004369 [Steccherinum ochraceum]